MVGDAVGHGIAAALLMTMILTDPSPLYISRSSAQPRQPQADTEHEKPGLCNIRVCYCGSDQQKSYMRYSGNAAVLDQSKLQ